MGTYDRLLPSSGQFISTYAGAPIEETAALGETLTQNFERGMQGVSAYNVMRNNASVLAIDEDMKNKIFDESYKGLKAYAEKGDYENAIPAIMNATTMVSGDANLKKAMAAKTTVDKFNVDLDKSDAQQWQKDLARVKLSQYQGTAAGDNVSTYMKMPSESVDIRKQMQAAADDVNQNSTVEEPVWNNQLQKFEIKTTKSYNPQELEAAMATAINNPETLAYIAEMQQAEAAGIIAEGTTAQMIDGYRVSIREGIDNDVESISWQTPSGKTKTGQSIGAGGSGGPGGALNVMPIQKKEGIDYVQVGENIEWDSTPFEERAAIRAQMNKEGGGFWGDVGNSITAAWDDIPTDEEIESFNKVANTTQNYYDIPDTEWQGYSAVEREDKMKEYIATAGKQQKQLNITGVNVGSEISSGTLPDVAAKWSDAKIGDEIAKDIQRNYSSRAMYNLTNQEQVEPGKDDNLTKAFAGEKGYSYTVLGDADSKNVYANSVDNPSLTSSYVMQVTDPDGEVTMYMVAKGEGYQRASSSAMSGYDVNKLQHTVSNKEFDTTVSDIYNTFPAPSYTDTYSDNNGMSFDGERSKDDPNVLIVSNLKSKYGDVNLQQIADQMNAGRETPLVQYDPVTGELYGLNDEAVAQLMLSIGLSK